MESAFDADLSAVRVHTGTSADRAARSVGASAYTVGPSIVFAHGAYAPSTAQGDAVLRHEIAHTVQDPFGSTVYRYDNVCEPSDEPETTTCDPDPDQVPVPEPALDPGAAAAAEAAELSDDELRARMTDTWGDVARGDTIAVASHDLYRFELARRRIAETAPTPGMQWLQGSDGIVWSLDAVHTRWQVERVYSGQAGVRPQEALDNLRARVEEIAVENGYSPVAGVPHLGELSQEQMDAVRVAEEIRELAERQFTEVQSEVDAFMASFEQDTLALGQSILDDSEQRIRQELLHYGIVFNTSEDDSDDDFDARVDEGPVSLGGPGYTLSEDAETEQARAGLREAASQIAASETNRRTLELQRNTVDQRITWIEDCNDPNSVLHDTDLDAQVDEGPAPISVDDYCAGSGAASEELDQLRDVRDALQRQLDEATRQLAELRATREDQFPLLATYTSGPQIDIDGLHQLATRVDATAIAADAQTKLANIGRVRSKLQSGDLKIWELPDLLSIAQQRKHVAAVSPNANAIHDRVVETGSSGSWRSIGIAVLSIGLGLIAAIPTAGASLAVTATVTGAEIAAATVDLYMISGSVSDHLTRSALTNTDYDRARALSHDEPSLFWLAVDIIGTVVGLAGEIHGAARGFREIAGARRAALAARNSEQVIEQIARMRRARAELGLATDVGERLELQLLSELPDRRLAEAVAAATLNAGTAEEIATRLGRRLTDRVGTDDLGALSRELGVPVTIDTTLTQEVRVMTELVDGRVVRARGIVIGTGATLGDIVQHRETLALLEDLERVTTELGARSDELLSSVITPSGAINPFPPGSQSFNSWMELRKYPELLQARYARIADGGISAAERAELREDIRFFETELSYHREIVDAAVLERGDDFIARSAASNEAAFKLDYPREFEIPATAEAPARTFTIGEPGSQYYYARAGDGSDRFVLRRYIDAVDAPAVTLTRTAEGAFAVVEGRLTRTEAGLALRHSWSQPMQDAFTNAEAALRAERGVYRVVPLAGIHRTERTIGSLMTREELDELRTILFESLSRNRSSEAARWLADTAIHDLAAHQIVVVRGTDQLRAFGYRAHFIGEAGEVEGDLHHLIPLYLGGDNRIRNLLDLDKNAHRRVHALLEGIEIDPDVTLAPNSIGLVDADFDAGLGILYSDGRVELRPLSDYMVSTPAADAVAVPVSSSVGP